jgi:hypothetical protein
MSHGFTKPLTLPLPVNQGGNGVTSLPYCRLWPSAATTCPQSAQTKITIDRAEFDPGSYLDAANNRWKPLVAGAYRVFGQIYFSSVATNAVVTCAIYKNGSLWNFGNYFNNPESAASSGTICSVSGIVQMNGSTDYIELFAFNATATGNATAYGSTTSYTFLEAEWIGP